MKYICVLIFFFLSFTTASADVSLPRIFSDHMVLQRDRPVAVWGRAAAREKVTVTFNGQRLRTKADASGKWKVMLQPMRHGGPFDLSVSGRNTIVLKNILIGDVWICSGQSNMAWMLKNTLKAEEVIAASHLPKMRLFTVPREMRLQPAEDITGGVWQTCTPESAADFSAVAYYFGRKIGGELDIPVGLINTSWGGTNIEAWTSWEVMSGLEEYRDKSLEEYQQEIEKTKINEQQFRQAISAAGGENWYAPETPVQDWSSIAVPSAWQQTRLGNTEGIVWYRKDIDLSSAASLTDAVLSLGVVEDEDETYVNGVRVGGMQQNAAHRIYPLANGVLRPGNNTIVVKMVNKEGRGGFVSDPGHLYLQAGGKKFPLGGEWQHKPAVLSADFGPTRMGPNAIPSQLYNAMIAPLVPFSIKGAIWYQGESNAGRAFRYRTLFPNMIRDWRTRWGYEFPFIWVQLANFMAPSKEPEESAWAELREAQHLTLSLPKSGEAVIIDIGEEKDIHPRNKEDVGDRLALAALKIAYDKSIVYTGPQFKSMTIEGNKVRVSFSETGTGLMIKDKYGYLKGFAIADESRKFKWAKGYIEGDDVVLYHDQVASPVAVRYAWGNNPDDANLYNREGLPASPFRTDQWPGITEKNNP